MVDVGCGDLSFWEARHCKSYIGIDIAENIIDENRGKRPEWKFIPANAKDKIEGIKGRVVFSLDLLFHIMNTDDFVKILENLCYYSMEWIYIYTWSINPFLQEKWQKLGKTVTDDKFQYYRPLRDYLEIFLSRGFNLEATRWPPWGGIGELFVFRKSELDSLLKVDHSFKP